MSSPDSGTDHHWVAGGGGGPAPPAPPAPLPPLPRTIWLIFAVALGLRLLGITFGLPELEARPDEVTLLNLGLGVLDGRFNPEFFHYGSLLPYVLAAIWSLLLLPARLAGTGWDVVLQDAAMAPDRLIIAGRALVALTGALTVFPVARLAERLAGARAAVPASALMAVAWLHVRDSHFMTTDVPQALLLVWAVWLLVRAVDRPELTRGWLWAGLVAGLATSTKYGGLVMIPLLLPAWWTVRKSAGQLASRGVFAWLSGLAIGFLVFTPWALLTPSAFLTDFAYEAFRHGTSPHGGIDLGLGFTYHFRETLPRGLGRPLFGAGLAGMVLALVRRPTPGLLIFGFPVLYYLTAGDKAVVFLRYMVPVVPFLCVAAGVLICGLASFKWRGRAGGSGSETARIGIVIGVLTAAVGLVPATQSLRFGSRISRADTRELTGSWLAANLTAGTTLLVAGLPIWPAGVRPDIQALDSILRVGDASPTSRGLLEGTLGEKRLAGFARISPQGGFRPWNAAVLPGGPGPDVVVVARSPLWGSHRHPVALERALRRDYALIHVEIGLPEGSSGVWLDQQDHFVFPFSGIGRETRPGPTLEVWRRRPDRAPISNP